MVQELEFPTMRQRDTFMREVKDKYCKDFYGLGCPVEHIHILGLGSPVDPDSPNSKLVSLYLDRVSDPNAVGRLCQFFGGHVRRH